MDILKSTIGSLFSAIVIVVLFGLWNDYVYKKDQLTGYWNVTYETTDTTYSPYKGLKTNYVFVINQKGDILSGTGEKISESSRNGYIEYDAEKRTHLNFEGALSYHVFSKNAVNMIHMENGIKRPSSRILNLVIESNDLMKGTFISTIAESKGKVILTRDR